MNFLALIGMSKKEEKNEMGFIWYRSDVKKVLVENRSSKLKC
jgi:hypothetical protein|tara:strand:- start:2101 stop:2226 length:126 start_codon:yes stop_codon:yes gene_type:complete